MLRKIAFVVACSLSFCLAAFTLAQDPQDKVDPLDAKIRQMMQVTGAGDLGKQAADQMCEAFAKMPGLPEGFLDRFQEVMKPEELVEMVVPIHRKHLDEKTIDAVIAFAGTEAGKKFYAAQPAILRESMEAGQKWGQDLAMKVLKDLNK